MKRLNQRGFSPFETVLLVLVVIILGFAGYVVLQKDKTDTNPKQETGVSTVSKSETKVSPAPDPTADWVSYKSSDSKMSLKHPKSWATATNPELCGDGILLLGANVQSVGRCASDNGGQMSFSWNAVDTSCGLSSSAYNISSDTAVTVDGVTGKKTVGVVKAGLEGPGPAAGTKITQYCFVKNGTRYGAEYVHNSSYPDVFADFEVLVTKTLKFS